MNGEKNSLKAKTNEFYKDVMLKEGNNTKKYKVKIPKGKEATFDDKKEYGKKDKVKTITGCKAVEDIDANKDKIKDIDKQPDVDIEVYLDKTTWGRCLRIKKVGDKDVEKPEETQVSIKANMFFWPTWTMIIGGIIIGLAIAGGLIWALLKKDGDEE